MAKSGSLQDAYLSVLCENKVSVSVYLVNGIKLEGRIEAFDQFALFLGNAVTQMVYKHAISTVLPKDRVSIPGIGDASEEMAGQGEMTGQAMQDRVQEGARRA